MCGCVDEECCEDRWICGAEDGKQGERMSLDFQVAAVSKPLLAVKRIVEKGNHVSFGPGEKMILLLTRSLGI
eukprot:11468103-Karenia_brevis.AAC.1